MKIIVIDAILNPLLSLSDWLSILIFATFIIIITNLIYKFSLDQKKVVEMKSRMKEIQKKSKEAPNEEKMKYLSEMNDVNSKYMKMTMKPMLITMIVVLLFIPWLNHNYGDIALKTNGTLVITGQNMSYVVGDNYVLIDGKNLTNGQMFKVGDKEFQVVLGRKNKLSRVIVRSPVPLPITGKSWGWLAYYFIISIPLSIGLRKIMKVNL